MAKKKKSSVAVSLPSLPKLPKSFKWDRKKVITGVVVVAVLVLLYLFRGYLVAATVNGMPISRLTLIRDLEKQGGNQALQSLISKELISQEAKKNNIVVTQDEINAEVAKVETTIKAQGQTLEQALETQGWTRADLEDQIRTQLTVEKLLTEKVKVTEEEIDNYIKETKSTDAREAITAQLKQSKLMAEYQTWIQDLLTKAKINYFVKF